MSDIEIKFDIEKYLNNFKYNFDGYIPSKDSIRFIEFIKLVNIDRGGEENKSPLVHYKMIDNIFSKEQDIAIMCHRGFSKSSMIEYLIWYIALFGSVPNFGKVNFGLYISDSIENGVKTMRNSIDNRYDNSSFLKEHIPYMRSTEQRIVFKNKAGSKFTLKLYGSKTGVRGAREAGTRPQIAFFDDLIQKSEDARSKPILESIENTIYSDVEDAMHPKHRKFVWAGTPFNQNDPLYKAIQSGAWSASVYPVCEKFPCKKDEFIGSWEDRFDWNGVNQTYLKRKRVGKTELFFREMMLRITAEEDRLIDENDIVWFNRDDVIKKKDYYNFYITTDFATSEKDSADYSAIFVWAINSNDDKMLVDGIMARQLMNKNIDDLFRLVQIYKPLSVGVEITGQQGGFISWIKDEMVRRRVYFGLASMAGSNTEGIRPTSNKFERFMLIQPQFRMKKIWFPKELKESKLIKETMNELKNITVDGIKSAHDESIDCISMLGSINIAVPSQSTEFKYNSNNMIWEVDDEDENYSNPFVI